MVNDWRGGRWEWSEGRDTGTKRDLINLRIMGGTRSFYSCIGGSKESMERDRTQGIQKKACYMHVTRETAQVTSLWRRHYIGRTVVCTALRPTQKFECTTCECCVLQSNFLNPMPPHQELVCKALQPGKQIQLSEGKFSPAALHVQHPCGCSTNTFEAHPN
jgi:hypothetical protein